MRASYRVQLWTCIDESSEFGGSPYRRYSRPLLKFQKFSITKSARGRPRKGEVKEYKRKKDRHRKPLIQIRLDENLFQQHKVCLFLALIPLPYKISAVISKIFKDGKRTLILCTKKIANAATAYYQKIHQPTTIYPCKCLHNNHSNLVPPIQHRI